MSCERVAHPVSATPTAVSAAARKSILFISIQPFSLGFLFNLRRLYGLKTNGFCFRKPICC